VRGTYGTLQGEAGCPRSGFAKRARGGDPRLSGAKERSEGLRPSERSAEEDTLARPTVTDLKIA